MGRPTRESGFRVRTPANAYWTLESGYVQSVWWPPPPGVGPRASLRGHQSGPLCRAVGRPVSHELANRVLIATSRILRLTSRSMRDWAAPDGTRSCWSGRRRPGAAGQTRGGGAPRPRRRSIDHMVIAAIGPTSDRAGELGEAKSTRHRSRLGRRPYRRLGRRAVVAGRRIGSAWRRWQ